MFSSKSYLAGSDRAGIAFCVARLSTGPVSPEKKSLLEQLISAGSTPQNVAFCIRIFSK
jgi:hypothetical protein